MTMFIRRVLVLAFLCATAVAEEPVKYSGPQPGERLPKFEVVDAFGPDEQKPYDMVSRFGDEPGMLVVIHDMLNNRSDEPSLGLAYVLAHYAATRKETGLQRSVVFLTDDVTAMKSFLTKIRRALPKNETPIVISTDGLEGPGSWGLNRNLRVTVVISNQGQSVANFALQQPSVQADTPRILKELVKLIGGDVPTLRDLDFPYYIAKPPSAGE